MEFFLTVLRKEGRKLEPLQKMPRVAPREIPFYEAFRHLSFSRSYTEGGPAALTITEILNHPTIAAMGPDWAEDCIDIIQAMDAKFLTNKRDKIAQDLKVAQAKAKTAKK